MNQFRINPEDGIVSLQVMFNDNGHAIGYNLLIRSPEYNFNVSGDNDDTSNDQFNLPSPVGNLVGKQLGFAAVVQRISPVNSWECTLIVKQGKKSQTFPLSNDDFNTKKDFSSLTVNFI